MSDLPNASNPTNKEAQNDTPQAGMGVPTGNTTVVIPVVSSQPQNVPPQASNPGVEEFHYQQKANFNLKKASRLFVVLMSLLIIVIPAIFIYLKFKPFGRVAQVNKGEVVWWVLGIDETVLRGMVDDYVKDNPNTKIKLVMQSETDYRERLANSLKNGSGPDIFSIHNSWVPMFTEQIDSVPETIYPKSDYTKDFYPVIVRNMSTTSGIVGIPLEYDSITLFINEEIFSYSGKTVPTTWDEFSAVASSLTTRGDKNIILQSGASVGLTDNVDYWPEIVALLMLQNKSDLYSPNGDNAYEAIVTYGEFFRTHKLWNNTLPNSTTAFAEGKVAMFFGPAKAASEIRKLNPSLKFKTVIPPQVRKDDPNEPEVSYATYWVQSVWKNSSNKPLAWNFLKYLSQEDSLIKMHDRSVELGIQPMIYPRISMRDKLINDRVLGSIVAQAPFALSWYLADKTYDGTSGINSVVNSAYKKVVDSASAGKGAKPDAFFKALVQELRKGLMTYNVSD